MNCICNIHNYSIYIIPKRSIAYTGLCDASASRFKHQRATPAPKPCKRTMGVFTDSSFKDIVHILSAVPTTGPISTYHPRYAVFKPIKYKIFLVINYFILIINFIVLTRKYFFLCST